MVENRDPKLAAEISAPGVLGDGQPVIDSLIQIDPEIRTDRVFSKIKF